VADAISLLDVWITEQTAHQNIPGLAIGIVYDQELIWAKGYGYSDLEQKTPVTSTTVFRMASITKTFTATATLHLRDAGKLRLDDPITQYLPWFEIQNPFEDAPDITIRHLLTHTAGLPREAAFPYWTDHVFPTREQIMAALPDQTLTYQPGSTYKYSNLGMSLLGMVVTAAAGEPYEQYVTKHILEPLGMTSTSVIQDEAAQADLTTAYLRRLPDGSRDVFSYYSTHGIAPAANIASSVKDIARYASLQFRRGPAGGEQILRGSTLEEMHRTHFVYSSWSGGRGLGFGVSRRNNKTIVSHGGWVGGNRTHLMFNPSEKIAVIVMINTEDASPYFFSYQAYDLVGPAIVEAVTPKPEKKRTDPAWKKYLGDYVDPWGWEVKVIILNNELVLYEYNYPPEDDPEASLTRLTPVDKHTFRMSDGELVVFEVDKRGKVIRIRKRYDYIYPRE
jgi:CubicO group peptidase (beta-lactamase class C family)